MQRPEHLEDQLHFLLSTLVQRELRDPELGFVTLTAVRLSSDRSVAKVYFTVLPVSGGDQEAQDGFTRKALGRAAGFLRTHLAHSLLAAAHVMLPYASGAWRCVRDHDAHPLVAARALRALDSGLDAMLAQVMQALSTWMPIAPGGNLNTSSYSSRP